MEGRKDKKRQECKNGKWGLRDSEEKKRKGEE